MLTFDNDNWGAQIPADTWVAAGKLLWGKETISELDAEFLTVNGWGTWTPKSGNFIFNTEVIDLSQKINISSTKTNILHDDGYAADY
jgi:hypothetical protein